MDTKPLPKNLQKKVTALAMNIYYDLSSYDLSSPASAKPNANYFNNTELLNHVLTQRHIFSSKKSSSTLFCEAIGVASDKINPIIDEKALSYLRAFVKHSSPWNPNLIDEIFLFFKNRSYFIENNIENIYKEIRTIFFGVSSILEIRGEINGTVLHALVGADDVEGMEQLLQIAPERKSELLEIRDELKLTILSMATSKQGTTDCAFSLLKDGVANVDALDSGGLSILDGTLFYGKPLLTKALLDRNCRLNFQNNVTINDDKCGTIVTALRQAGYFLSSKRGKVSFLLVNEKDPLLQKEISEISDLDSTDIIPSDQQLLRLNHSFTEALAYAENGPDHEILQGLFNALTTKYHIEPLGLQFEIASLESRSIILTSLMPAMLDQLFSNYRTIENTFEIIDSFTYSFKHTNEVLDSRILAKTIDSLYRGVDELDSNGGDPDLITVVQFLCYKMTKWMILPFLQIADKQQIDKVKEKIFLIIIVGLNHVMNFDNNVNIESTLNRLDDILEIYDQKGIHNQEKKALKLYENMLLFLFHSQCGLHEEAHGCLKLSMDKSNSDVFKDHKIVNDYTSILNHYFTSFVLSSESFYHKVMIHHSIHRFISQPFLKGAHGFIDLSMSCENFFAEIMEIYLKYISLELTNPLFKAQLLNGSVYLHVDNPEINSQKLNKVLKQTLGSIVECSPHGYRFHCYSSQLTEVHDIVKKLNLITLEQISSLDQSTEPSSCSISTQENPKEATYLPSWPYTLNKKGKSSVKNQAKNQTPSAEVENESPSVNMDVIREKIRTVLGLGDRLEIYALNHPRYAKNKSHLCWGVWSPHFGSGRPESVTDDILSKHKRLLIDQAPIEIPKKGANGFKATNYHDVESNKILPTYKTKCARENSRFIAAHYQVSLDNGELANVYCFGKLDLTHGEKLTEIDRRTFLTEVKKGLSPT